MQYRLPARRKEDEKDTRRSFKCLYETFYTNSRTYKETLRTICLRMVRIRVFLL